MLVASSMMAAMTPSPSSSQSVPGTWPATRLASVNAPNATKSPCGMNVMRVTENTTMVASASRT
jgi:hypothetical protein